MEKIAWFVLPCAIGLLAVGVVVGALLAGVLGFDRGAFVLRFGPLFCWAGTFALALYLGRHPRSESAPAPREGEGFMWSSGPAR